MQSISAKTVQKRTYVMKKTKKPKEKRQKKPRVSLSDVFYCLKDLNHTPREERLPVYRFLVNMGRVVSFILLGTGIFQFFSSLYAIDSKGLDFTISGTLMLIAVQVAIFPFRLYKKKKWDRKGKRHILVICMILTIPIVFAAMALALSSIGIRFK